MPRIVSFWFAAVEGVVAAIALERVAAVAAQNRIVPLRAGEHVVEAGAVQVLDADEPVAASTDRVLVAAKAE